MTGPVELQADTLHTLFEHQCSRAGEHVAYVALDGGGRPAGSLRYGELHACVSQLASRLQATTAPGDRVLLILPTGLEFACALWACLVTGRVAVPVPDPGSASSRQSLLRLQAVMADAQPSLIFMAGTLPPQWAAWTPTCRAEQIDLAALRAAPRGLAVPAASGQPVGADLAYLQYTSGSTGAPRGVMLSHHAVLAQMQALSARLGLQAASRSLCWMPLFHDFGLVMGLLAPFMVGASSYLMSPQAFVRRPLRWWEVVAEQGITHTGGPHFAYAACLRALAQQPDWRVDLSGVEATSCGAEPIHALTVQAWQERMACCGLRAHTFTPGYGMAETVLGVTGHEPAAQRAATLLPVSAQGLRAGRITLLPADAAHADVQWMVSCGRPFDGVQLQIVDPDTGLACTPGGMGEVWVQGGTVGQGYWQQPEATQASFGATLPGQGQATWLRTGDLGFVHAGELYVTGRLKDLIILRGRNVFPQDIEWSASRAHELCRADGVAAFSVEGTSEGWLGEELVVVQELPRRCGPEQWPEVVRAIRQAIAIDHELAAQVVVLVASGSVPRTSSGKVRRRACREAWQADELKVLWVDRLDRASQAPGSVQEAMPCDPLEHSIWAIWRELLPGLNFGVHTHFFELGGHSLTATQLMSRLSSRLGIDLPLAVLFEHPTVAGLADAVRQQLGEQAAQAWPPIARIAREGLLPVSFSQRRMWLVQQLDPASTAYNIPIVLRMTGRFNRQAWLASIDLLMARHEAFRTRFTMQHGQLQQHVQPVASLDLTELDLGDMPVPLRDAHAQQVLRRQARHVFDVTHGALHRMVLIRINEQEHLVMWLLHHLIGDQWSAAVLLRELAQGYNAMAQGQSPQLPALEIDEVDHAAWQHGLRHSPVLAGQWAYWREQLADLPDQALPTDKPMHMGQALGGAQLSCALPQTMLSGLQRLAVQQGVTPFMILLACLDVLLWRLTGQTDVAVATPVANRTRFDTEGVVGTLVNTLVMRNRLQPEQSFSALLTQVRRTALEAYTHQDMAFDDLVERLGRAGRGGGLPLGLQVMLNMHNAPLGDVTFDGLDWRVLSLDRGATQFPLAITVDTELTRQVHLEYADTVIDAATADRWLRHFMGLLTQVVRNPDQALSDYTLLDEQDLLALRHWNDTTRPWTGPLRVDQCVLSAVQGISRVVLLSPAHHEAWTGQQLAARVRGIARYLRSQGVGRGHRVGLSVPRRADMVAAMLGVLHAGAAYVPLDPAYPAARLADMAEDAELSLLLTHTDTLASLDWFGGTVVCLDQPGIIADQMDDLPPDTALDALPDSPAYVIYTSGSTGRPKGVVVPHAAVVNLLRSMAHEPGLQTHDRLLAVTTLSFDIAVLELLLPLLCGARVVLASRESAQDGVLLRQLIEREQITAMQATPATWRLLLTAGWPAVVGLKALVGGEALAADLAEQLLGRVGQLWNMYGPTETTIWSSCARVQDVSAGITVGRPIANTEIWVLDEQQRPCPPGMPGELAIGDWRPGCQSGLLAPAGVDGRALCRRPLQRRRDRSALPHR